MKYLDEYRDGELVRQLSQEIHRVATQPWTIMEICGGQTHSILKFGLEQLLPGHIELLHGPGCPVCVTPLELIDSALQIAVLPNVIFTSFGDMLRVPGSESDLLRARAQGADVRIVYSPLDALTVAVANPGKEVVFFAVGFETTAPATALAVLEAARRGIRNFSMVVAHVLVPPAIESLMSEPDCRVQAFLAAGHVCSVMGCAQYVPLAEKYQLPIVVTGFEPVDILQGVLMAVRQLESGRAGVENQYARSVRPDGNRIARQLFQKVFVPTDRRWRGLGLIPQSGLRLNDEFSRFDAERKFNLPALHVREPGQCIAGLVLQGRRKPGQCPAFAQECTPEHPLGASMVSSEGACSAYYRYSRRSL